MKLLIALILTFSSAQAMACGLNPTGNEYVGDRALLNAVLDAPRVQCENEGDVEVEYSAERCVNGKVYLTIKKADYFGTPFSFQVRKIEEYGNITIFYNRYGQSIDCFLN